MSQTLLKLQIGPVQDFIAQARSTRDLWSGSYLLSWLVSAGLCKLVGELEKSKIAPIKALECVIFPNLKGQPLFDLQRKGRDRSIEAREYLTPNIPNLFMAALPVSVDQATDIAKLVEGRIRSEWKAISESCWDKLIRDKMVSAAIKSRFDHQSKNFLNISWQCTPNDSDYETGYQKNGRELDAVRQTRVFNGWSSGQWRRPGEDMNKDSLTGREEVICGGNDWWKAHVGSLQESDPKQFEYWRTVFRERQSGDLYGAVTLVKRLWHRVYLSKEGNGGFKVSKDLPIPSTFQTAIHDPDKDVDDEIDEPEDDKKHYFALLLMDGDEMGKWLSGDKNLKIEAGAHCGFSTALSGFALQQARVIVSKHDGCLIYAGGDDVLALLPADTALACGQDLRETFRSHVQSQASPDWLLQKGEKLDMDVSVGIAIAHYKEPLQDVFRGAQAAERRAKKELSRAAFSVTIIKHAGETVQWGSKWDSSQAGLFQSLLDGVRSDILSARFPYRMIEVLSRYLSAKGCGPQCAPEFVGQVDEIIATEFALILERQKGPVNSSKRREWLNAHEPQKKLKSFISLLPKSEEGAIAKLEALIELCKTAGFAMRNEGNLLRPPAATSNPAKTNL